MISYGEKVGRNSMYPNVDIYAEVSSERTHRRRLTAAGPVELGAQGQRGLLPACWVWEPCQYILRKLK